MMKKNIQMVGDQTMKNREHMTLLSGKNDLSEFNQKRLAKLVVTVQQNKSSEWSALINSPDIS